MFHPEGGATWSLDEDHLAKMLEVTGDEFNDTMLRFSLRRDEFFDEEGALIFSEPSFSHPRTPYTDTILLRR